MKKSLQEALTNTDTTYKDLVKIADDIIAHYVVDVNKIIEDAQKVEKLTNDDIRNLITKLALKAYQFGDVKEKSSLKAECAEALRKEAYAIEFNALDGSVASKDSAAILNISSEIMTEAVYNLVASLFKTKLDELHRIIDTLKTVLTSRLQEAKLTQMPSSQE